MQTTSNFGFYESNVHQAYYDKKLLQRLLPNLVFATLCEERNLPKNQTDYIAFRRIESLAAQTTPLTEGVNPSPIAVDDTIIRSQIQEFGAYAEVSSKLTLTDYDPVITRYSEVFGENAANSIDQYTRDVLMAGTYFIRIQGATTLTTSGLRNTVAYPITKAALDAAIVQLESYDVPKWEGIINASGGYNTSPIPEAYVCVVHPHVKKDILAIGEANGIIPAFKYANTTKLMKGEFAAYEGGIRFVSTTNGKIWPGEGAAGTTYRYTTDGTTNSYDVYGCLVVGKGYAARTNLDGGARVIVKTPKEIGGALERYGTVGWQANYQTTILNEYCGVRIECCATV